MSEHASTDYSHPPIIEAVIELLFDRDVPFEECEKAAKKLADRYFLNEVDLDIETQVAPGLGQLRYSQQPAGHRLTTLDRSEIFLIQRKRLVAGQTSPYPGWPKFTERARRDFARARELIGNPAFSRVGVRYINRIDVPIDRVPVGQLGSLLTFEPAGPPIGTSLLGFTMQTEFDLGEDECRYRLTSAIVESPVPDRWSILLDIDVIRLVDIPKRDDDLWALLARMREHKNTIFEACLKDSARELFR